MSTNPPIRIISEKTILILNGNANKRHTQTRNQLWETFHRDSRIDVVVSESLENLERITDRILREGHGVIFVGSGDGGTKAIYNQLIRKNPEGALHPGLTSPLLVPLPLGTGNAYAHLIGADENPENAILDVLGFKDIPLLPPQSFPLIGIMSTDLEGRTTVEYGTFMGQGWDAMILNDYQTTYKGQGLPGYLKAALGNSFGRVLLKGESTMVRVSSKCGELYQIKKGNLESGKIIVPEESRTDLLRGETVNTVIAGTTPTYGYNMKAFPLAEKAIKMGERGMMQLRVIIGNPRKTVAKMVAHAWGSFQGTYFPDWCKDYFAEQITVEAPEGLAFQNAGDAEGIKARVEYSISPFKLAFVDLARLSKN
jgi:hypothetical protein